MTPDRTNPKDDGGGHNAYPNQRKPRIILAEDDADMRDLLSETLRAAGKFTVPSLLQLELDTNPFLRSHVPEVQQSVDLPGADPVAVFTAVRKAKDNF